MPAPSRVSFTEFESTRALIAQIQSNIISICPLSLRTTLFYKSSIAPRIPRRRPRGDGRHIRRTVLHRPILPTTAGPPSARTVVARQLIAQQRLIDRIAALAVRILIQVSRIRVLPPSHCWLVETRVLFVLTRTHASVVDALEGSGAVGEADGGDGVEVDDGGACAAGTLEADIVVLAVGGGYVACILGGKEAAVGGRLVLQEVIWGTWASHVKSVEDASWFLRRVRTEERAGEKCGEGRAKTVVLEQRRAMIAKALD